MGVATFQSVVTRHWRVRQEMSVEFIRGETTALRGWECQDRTWRCRRHLARERDARSQGGLSVDIKGDVGSLFPARGVRQRAAASHGVS